MTPPAPRLTREAQLVEQAIQLFSRGGYRETSLQQVTDALGITRPLFYYYFESKEDLLWRIIGRLGDDLLDAAQPIGASPLSAAERITRIIDAHARAILENIDAFRIYFAERHLLSGDRDHRLRRGEEDYLELVAAVIADGQRAGVFRPGAPRVLSRMLTGMANSMTRWYVDHGLYDIDELSSLAADIVARSLAVEPDG
jgi:AcrR family transcriptional regulator